MDGCQTLLARRMCPVVKFLYPLIDGGIADLAAKERFDKVVNKDICIDITPGLKPYSVAAAIMTLNENLKFSYVTTDGLLRFYDADVSISS